MSLHLQELYKNIFYKKNYTNEILRRRYYYDSYIVIGYYNKIV